MQCEWQSGFVSNLERFKFMGALPESKMIESAFTSFIRRVSEISSSKVFCFFYIIIHLKLWEIFIDTKINFVFLSVIHVEHLYRV